MLEKMETLYFIFVRQLRSVGMNFFRYLHHTIDWSNRLIFISGPRGSGKTTLLLQHILKEFGETPRDVLYVSLDHIWFSANTLYDLGMDFVLQGGRYLFLDEVHKYHDWSREVKNLYDAFPELNIVITGSSILEIYRGEADLSRRAVHYSLPGLSFREFLSFENLLTIEPISLGELLENHVAVCSEITKSVKILPAFSDYLSHGYFPYYKEDVKTYHQRLLQTINTVLEVDLPAVKGIDYASLDKIKQLLYIIAQMVPFTPNISQLSEKIGVSRNSLLAYLRYLESAQVIQTLKPNKGKLGRLTKPEKIYLNHPNYIVAFVGRQLADKGTMRETFFCNQLKRVAEVSSSDIADFKVDHTYFFEVGGRNKGREQIMGLEHAYIAADDIELGFRDKIPLWLFGFLY